MESGLYALYAKEHQRGRFSGVIGVKAQADSSGEFACEIACFGVADARKKVPLTPSTRFPIASISKQFTAVAALLLWQRGLLDLFAPIGPFFQDLNPVWGERVTAHHLLSHTSGLPSLFRPHKELKAFSESHPQNAPIATAALIAALCQLPLRYPPGTRFEYGNSDYVLLSALIERIAKLPFADFVAQEVLAVAGLHHTAVAGTSVAARAIGHLGGMPAEAVHPSWLRGAGDYESTAGDLLRWSGALRQDVLLAVDARRRLFSHIEDTAEESRDSYGYAWHISTAHNRKLAWHDGLLPGLALAFFHSLDDETAAILFCNQLPSGLHGRSTLRLLHQMAAPVFDFANSDLGKASELAKSDVPPASLFGAAATYALDDERHLRIELRHDRLWLTTSDTRPFTLTGLLQNLSSAAVLARQRAESFLQALAKDDLAAAEALCGPYLLDHARLSAVFFELRRGMGPLLEVTWLQNEGSKLVIHRCRFAKSSLDAQVSLDGDGAIAGFYFHPPGTAPAVTELPLFIEGPRCLRSDGCSSATADGLVILSDDGPPPTSLILREEDESSHVLRAVLVQ